MKLTRDMLRMDCRAIPGIYLFKDFNKEWESVSMNCVVCNVKMILHEKGIMDVPYLQCPKCGTFWKAK